MPRLRLGVALLLPPPVAAEVDGLRRACDDGALDRVPPHLTLVPPVNVREAELPDALRVLREAASRVRPFRLRLGPPSTFLPATPTLHLAVGGRGRATSVLRELRDAVFRPPLERELTFPFVPHVTLADGMDPDRIAAAVEALAGFVVEVQLDRVHLLREVREEGGRRWVPVADAPFAPPVVVGRGGVELDLAVSRLLDPEAAAAEATWRHAEDHPHADDRRADQPHADRDDDAEPGPGGRHPGAGSGGDGPSLVVVARRRGEVVGVARGVVGPDDESPGSLTVAPEHRRQGVARQLAAAYRHAAQLVEQERHHRS